MNELPDELLVFIFEHLKIRDLIQCSLVCKRFKLLCQDVKIPELIVNDSTVNTNGFWFYTKKKFNLQDAVDVTTFNSYRSIFRLDKFRRLYFTSSLSEYDQLEISDFTHLEQVKIDVELGVGVEHKTYIDLPNVKTMELCTGIYRAHHNFFVTAPKLRRLKCEDFDVIHLTYPNRILLLETTKYRESFYVLKNLKLLVIADVDEFNYWDTFCAFRKLKKIAFNAKGNSIPKSVKDMVRCLRIHRRLEPKVYFLSVELNNSKKIRECNNILDPFLFQIENYSSLLETVFIPSNSIGIMYSHLLHSMEGNIPEDFFKKYFSANCVLVEEKVQNQDHLFRFLKKFDYLSELYLQSDSLDQCYLNRLDELDQLSTLSVGHDLLSISGNAESILNFDFLLRLENLTRFRTEFASSQFFDLTLKLFTHLKHFRSMIFEFDGTLVDVSRMRTSDKYSILCFPHFKSSLDFNELVCVMKVIKSEHIHKDKPTAKDWFKGKFPLLRKYFSRWNRHE